MLNGSRDFFHILQIVNIFVYFLFTQSHIDDTRPSGNITGNVTETGLIFWI